MTVRELIAELVEYNMDAEVEFSGDKDSWTVTGADSDAYGKRYGRKALLQSSEYSAEGSEG